MFLRMFVLEKHASVLLVMLYFVLENRVDIQISKKRDVRLIHGQEVPENRNPAVLTQMVMGNGDFVFCISLYFALW